MNRRDFLKFTGVLTAAIASPQVAASLLEDQPRFGKYERVKYYENAEFEFVGEYLDCDWQYGIAVSIGKGEDRIRHGTCTILGTRGKVSSDELNLMATELRHWAIEKGYVGFPSNEEIIKRIRA